MIKHRKVSILIFILLLIFSLEYCNFMEIGRFDITIFRIYYVTLLIYIFFKYILHKDAISINDRNEFICFIFISTIFALLRYWTQNELPTMYMGYYISMTIVFFYFSQTKITNKQYNIIEKCIIIFLFINFLIGLNEFILNKDLFTLDVNKIRYDGLALYGLSGIRTNGFFNDGMSFAISMDLLIIILLIKNSNRKQKFIKLINNIITLAIFITSNIICYFSTNIIMFILLIYLYFIIKNKRKLVKVFYISVFLSLILFAFFNLVLDSNYFIIKSSSGLNTRIGGFLYNLNIIKRYPFLGTNLDSGNYHLYERVMYNGALGNYESHNMWLELIVNCGLYMLIPFLYFLHSINMKIRNAELVLKMFFWFYLAFIGSDFNLLSLININCIVLSFILLNSNYRNNIINGERLMTNST